MHIAEILKNIFGFAFSIILKNFIMYKKKTKIFAQPNNKVLISLKQNFKRIFKKTLKIT